MGRVSLNEVFVNIKSNNASIIENQRRIRQILDKMKSLKVGRNALTEYNLSFSPKKPFEGDKNSDKMFSNTHYGLVENQENIPNIMSDPSFNKMDDNIHEEMAKMRIGERQDSSENHSDKIRENFERKSKLYTNLYEVLRKRKQVPTQSINLDRLPVLEKVDGLKTMPIVLTDTSFFNLKTQPSPNTSQQQQQQPQPPPQFQPQVSSKQGESNYSSSPQTQQQFNLKMQLPHQQNQQSQIVQQQFKQQMNTPPPSQIMSTNLNTVTSTPTVNATFSFNNPSPMPASTINSKQPMFNLNASSQQATVQKSLFPSLNSNQNDSALKLPQSNNNASSTVTNVPIMANANNKPLTQPTENLNKPLVTTVAPTPTFSLNIGSKQPQTASSVPPLANQQSEQVKPKQEEKTQHQAQSKSEIKPVVVSTENQDSTITSSSSTTTTPATSLFGKTPSGSLFGAGSSTSSQTAPFSFSFANQKTSNSAQFSFGASASTITNIATATPQDSSSKPNQTSSTETTNTTVSTTPAPSSLTPKPSTVFNTPVNESSKPNESLPSSSTAPVATVASEQTKIPSLLSKTEKVDTTTKPVVTVEPIPTTQAATSTPQTTTTQAPPSALTQPPPSALTQPPVNQTAPIPTFSGASTGAVQAPVVSGGLFDTNKNQTQPATTSLFGNSKLTTTTTNTEASVTPKPIGTALFSGFLPTAVPPTAPTTTNTATPLANPFSAVAAATTVAAKPAQS